MSNGYLFVVNNQKKYLDLLDIALNSVLCFSDKPIEVFGINFDYKNDNKRVKSRRLNIFPENFDSICFSKYDAMLNSGFDSGIYLDTDIIATGDIDKIFSYVDLITEYPLLPLHSTDNQDISFLMNTLGVKLKTQKYTHASIYLFNKKCHDFLKACKKSGEYLVSNNIISFAGDEGVTNCMLWMYNTRDVFIPLCDPHYQDIEIKLGISKEGIAQDCLYYVAHGCKDKNRAKVIFDCLKEKKGFI